MTPPLWPPVVPVCPEDELLRYDDPMVACGPAMDDVAWTLSSTECSYLVGTGAYEGGRYEEYACAAPAMPDTAVAPIEEGVMPFVTLLVLFMGLAVARWKEDRR